MFTDEQLEILRKGFQEHDFTQAVPLNPSYEGMTPEQAKAFEFFKNLTMGYMHSNLPSFNIKRPTENFTQNHPVNLLMNANASYISNEAMKIALDKARAEAAADRFMELFAPLIEQEAINYCKAKNIDPEDATDEDAWNVLNRVATAANETMSGTVMTGQQFAEISKIVNVLQTHEDFGEKRNPDAINFHNKWTHAKTKIGEMLSLESIDESVPTDMDTDAEYRILRDEFCDTLDDTDSAIFYQIEDGKTQREIAAALGYKTPSTVSKRIHAIRKKYEEFIKDDDE